MAEAEPSASAGASTLKKAGVEIGRRSTAVALERLRPGS
jgi:hypothetical protein